jgi:MYXO-CTERM domain-containing protein
MLENKLPFGRSLLCTAALLAALGPAQATVLYTGTLTLTAASPTQLGRVSRTGIPQDWSGGATFGGLINATTTYHYLTLDLDLSALESSFASYGGYIQISIDSTATTTFLSAYADTYNPLNPGATWIGDDGSSGNYFPGDTSFFQVIVPSPKHLVLMFNETTTNGGLNLPASILVEAFTDTQYTDLVSNVPEPATWAFMLGGLALLPALRRRSA